MPKHQPFVHQFNGDTICTPVNHLHQRIQCQFDISHIIPQVLLVQPLELLVLPGTLATPAAIIRVGVQIVPHLTFNSGSRLRIFTDFYCPKGTKKADAHRHQPSFNI